MDIINQILSKRAAKAQREKARKLHALTREYAERIQAKEFEGRMYISLDGVPLFDTSTMKIGIVDALTAIRQTIIKYKLR